MDSQRSNRGELTIHERDGGIFQEACGLCYVDDALFKPIEEYIGTTLTEYRKAISESHPTLQKEIRPGLQARNSPGCQATHLCGGCRPTEEVLQAWLLARKNRSTHGGPALFPSKTSQRLSLRGLEVEVEKHAARAGLHDPASKLLEKRFTPRAQALVQHAPLQGRNGGEIYRMAPGRCTKGQHGAVCAYRS